MPDAPRFRTLIGPDSLPRELDSAGLAEAYAWPDGLTVRANMITSLDGAVTGSDGLSGSLSDPADRAVFTTLRAGCDAIVVGAGTARAENYGPPGPGQLLVVISRSGELPPRLRADPARVVLVLPERPETPTAGARPLPGEDSVWSLGGPEVAPRAVVAELHRRGRRRILLEGGPQLLAAWLAAGCVDELCLTWAARLIGGGRTLLPTPVGPLSTRPRLLLDAGATLLGRWDIVRDD